MTDSCTLPDFTLDDASRIARDRYGLSGSIKPLDGERDLNFLIDTGKGKFVLKIANIEESPAMLDCQHAVFERLGKAGVFPHIAIARQSLSGSTIEMIVGNQGMHASRVLPFIEGRMLAEVEILSPDLLTDLGYTLARLDHALTGFTHPALERALLWDLSMAAETVDTYQGLLRNCRQESLVTFFRNRFCEQVLPKAGQFRRAVIHNDANRGNVVVDNDAKNVVSLIDFGDMIETWLVAEVAIAGCYVMLGKPDPLQNVAHLLRGYHAELPLLDIELDAIFDLICMRLCTSVCICAHQRRLAPDNAYLSIDEADAWALLENIQDWDINAAKAYLRKACV